MSTNDAETQDADEQAEEQADADAEDEHPIDSLEPFSFEATIDTIDAIVDPVESCNEEAIFEFNDDGIVAHIVDPAKVLMAEVTAPADAFESYDGGALKTSMPLQRFTDMAKTADSAHVAWDLENGTLEVESGPVDATMNTFDPSTVETKRPTDQVFEGATCEWTMPSDDLKTALGATSKMGGNVVDFVAEPDGTVGLVKNGDGKNRVRADFDHASLEENPDDRVVASHAEEYLQKVRKAIPTITGANNDVDVTFQTAPDYPVIMQWTHEGVSTTMVQAPRLDMEGGRT